MDAVTRWQKHSENFSKEDAKLEEAIMAAANVFQAARAHLEETKEALAEFDNLEEQIQEISGGDLMSDQAPPIFQGKSNRLCTI